MQIQIHQRQPHHVWRDVVTPEIQGKTGAVIRRERAFAFGIHIIAQNVFVSGNQETGGAAGGVENSFCLLRLEHLDHEIDDVARGAELAGIALRAQHRQQVLEGVAQALAVVVTELVDDLEESAQRLRVAIRQIGVFENVAKQRRDARVLRHLVDAFGIQRKRFMAAQARMHQMLPAVTRELAGEEFTISAHRYGLGVHVVHELVDQGDGDLFDLRLRVRHFAHQNVAGRVDAAFGIGIEHRSSYGEN